MLFIEESEIWCGICICSTKCTWNFNDISNTLSNKNYDMPYIKYNECTLYLLSAVGLIINSFTKKKILSRYWILKTKFVKDRKII